MQSIRIVILGLLFISSLGYAQSIEDLIYVSSAQKAEVKSPTNTISAIYQLEGKSWKMKGAEKDTIWTKILALLPATQNVDYQVYCTVCQNPLKKMNPIKTENTTLISHQHEQGLHKREILLEYDAQNHLVSKENIITKFEADNSENLQNFSINFDYRYEGGRLRQATAKYIIAERHSEGMLVSSFEEHVNINYNDKNNTVEIIYDNENQPTKVKYILTWK